MGIPQAPFAKAAGNVAGLFQHFCDRHVFVIEVPVQAVIADRRVAAVEACHQHTAAGSADIGTRIELVKFHSLGGQAVDGRRANLGLPVAAAMSATKIVGQDENNVWRTGLRGGGCRDRQNREGKNGAKHGNLGVGRRSFVYCSINSFCMPAMRTCSTLGATLLERGSVS